MPESLRRNIGKYLIQAELGRGGFGVVYRAYDPTVGRPVAVKVLTALGDDQLLTRFKNEAAATGNLRHKNIVTIYDYGDDNGLPYIVMELLEGEDLNQAIAARRLIPLLQKVSIMVQVADGLWSAHRAGVVHRDVKPGNIRLLPDGTVKLMDFGIARLVAGSASTRLTRQGHVIGTLSYMSPEQILGDEVDALSDVFAYGSTYYELLTGKHPFHGSDPRSVFHKITSEDPEPIRNLVPDCPEALERIVNRTLQKDRDLRYQSLRDVQVDTEPILIDLRQERAESLVAEAKRLYSTSNLEGAQTVLSEVFDLDPANREARRLRETIQNQVLDRLIRPKIDALVKKADDATCARRYEEAIESIEAALRLDRDSRMLAERLEEARRLLAVRREIGGLLADARRQFSKQNLEGALEILLRVVERDASDPDAQHFLAEVRTALTRREKEREFQDWVRKAKELLEAQNFDGATALLDQLDPEFKDREELKGLAAQIRLSKEQFERQQLLAGEITAVRDLLAARKFEGAIAKLEQLMKAFPDELEPTKLFIVAHKELAAHRKAESLDKLGNELSRLVADGSFDRALSLVAQSLKTYPAEPRLVKAQSEIEEQWARAKREAAIREVLEDSERLVQAGDFETAVDVLEASCQEYPDDLRLSGSLTSARDALASKRREQGIAKAAAEAQSYLGQSRYDQALETVGRAAAEYGDDPRLSGLHQKIFHAKAAWERTQAARELIEKSKELVLKDDFQAALELLQSGIAQFPNEPELSKSLAATKAALSAKQREDGIERLCAETRAHQVECRFEEALKAVDRGFAEYGKDRRLTDARDEVVAAKAAWERSEAIREVTADSQKALEHKDFVLAIGLLESALKRYPREPSLTDGLNTARSGLAAKSRDEAIEALCQKVQAQTDKRDFGAALKALDRGFAEYGSDPRLLEKLELTLAAKAAWQRTAEVARVVESAQQRLAKGQPESALEILEPALRRYADERRLLEIRTAAENALAASRREQAIEALGQRVRNELEAGAYGTALELVEHGLEQNGGDSRLIRLREKTIAAKTAWERDEAVRQVVREAQASLAAGNSDEAISTVQLALTKYPDDKLLQETLASARRAADAKRRDDAIDALIREAHTQGDGRQYSRALTTIDRGIAEFGTDERLAEARAKIVTAKTDWERAEAVGRALEESNALLSHGQPALAVQRLEAALKSYPAESRLTAALDAARKSQAAARREQAIGSLMADARNLLEAREFGNALRFLERGRKEYGPDDRLSNLHEEVAKAKADWERTQSFQRLLEKWRELMRARQPENALALLESDGGQFEGEPQVVEAIAAARNAMAANEQRETAIQTACRSAQDLAKAHDYGQALQVLAEAQNSLGSDSRINDIRDEVAATQANWKHSQAIRAVLAESQRRISANDAKSAVNVIGEALTRFPNEAELVQAFAHAKAEFEIAQREDAIAALSAQTQIYIDAQDYSTALEELNQALEAYGPETRLSGLRASVLAARERAAALRRVIDQGNHLVAQNEPDKACNLLEQASITFPDEPLLLEVLASARSALEGKKRDEVVNRLSAQVRRDLARGEFDAALSNLAAGFKASPDDDRLQDLRDSVVLAKAEAQRVSEQIRAVVEAARELSEQGQREDAIAVLERAWNERPGRSELVAAVAGMIDTIAAEGNESVDEICREARRYVLTGKLDLAFHSLERALHLQGAEQPGTEQEAETATRSERAKAAVSGSPRLRGVAPVASVKEATEEQPLPGAAEETDWIRVQNEHGTHTTAASDSGAIREEDRRSRVAPVIRARQPSRKRWIIIGVAAALFLTIVFVATRWLLTPRISMLQVRASPPGTMIRVNDKQCSTPSCEFQLPPGQYRIQLSAEGYKDKVAAVTLHKGDAPPTMVFALEPLSPTLTIAANFAAADVRLDERTAGRLKDGQFSSDVLSAGQHTVRISGSEGTAAVSFNTDHAKLPTINKVSQQNTQVIAATTFGKRGSFACSDCTGPVTVDGRSVGEMKDNGITLSDLAPGTHTAKIGNELSVVFNASSTPAVNLVVNSTRVGAMVVETNVDNATVYVDGNKYPKLTSGGQVLIQADAKQHVVRVAKNGYRVEPPEMKLQLSRGDQLRARFNLMPEPAHLVVTRQLPDTSVSLDGARIGTVGRDGSFSADIAPGSHRIEFTKDNYTTAQVTRSFEGGRKLALSGADAPLVAKVAPNTPAPASPAAPSTDPKAAEQAAWQSIVGTQNAAQLQDYLDKYPGGSHKDEAQARLREVRARQASAAREGAWNAADKSSRASLEDFLSKYGDGSHAQDARSLIATLDKQHADELAAGQRAKERATGAAADSAAIAATLAQFEAAYNGKDLASLQSIWTGMPKNVVDTYRSQFRDARSIEFRLTPDRPVTVNGNEAVAICNRALKFVARNGARPPEMSEKVRVGLERSGSQWVIRTITSF